MSRTKRSNRTSEVLRSVAPYKRIQRQRLLSEFEREYRALNSDPLIEL